MIKTYLIKFMLQQSESRFFGFLILICFCGCCFLALLDVLLPLLLLLLLLFWWLAVPFLADLFGAIALLVFSYGFFINDFLPSRSIQVVNSKCVVTLLIHIHSQSGESHCGKTRFLIHKVFLQSNRFCAFSPASFFTLVARSRIDCFRFLSTLNFNNCRFSTLNCSSFLVSSLFTPGLWVNTWTNLKNFCTKCFFRLCSKSHKTLFFWLHSVLVSLKMPRTKHWREKNSILNAINQ